MNQELVGDGRRGDALGGEVVALVAQGADDLGGQRVVEQADDVLAPRSVARRDGAFLEAALGSVIALIAGMFGFTGIAAGAAGIAKILFVVFLVLFVAVLLFALLGAKAVSNK